MKALVITEHGPPDVLRVEERPDPEPGPGEVRIRVRAAGVNFADLLGRVGLYPDVPKPPCVVGYEVAGDGAAAHRYTHERNNIGKVVLTL
jgi:synaptic vesicle membrane protein VAT-1